MKTIESKFLKKSMLFVPNGGIVVEIGSWKGGSGETLSKGIEKYCPDTKLFCVDPFDQNYFMSLPGLKVHAEKEDIYKIFLKRMKKYKYTHHRMLSVEAAKEFEDGSVNLVFIDGNHAYEALKADIKAWWPKLAENGIMCGHDYGRGKYGVTNAVQESFKHFSNPAYTIWKTQKFKDNYVG